MDKREMLKSMLNNFINDKPEEATLDLHNYLSSKMREISGLAAPSHDEPQSNEIETGTSDLESEAMPPFEE